jgi:hypothetical protein
MTTKVFSLAEFIVHLGVVEREMHQLGSKIIEKACEMVCEEAKRVMR